MIIYNWREVVANTKQQLYSEANALKKNTYEQHPHGDS